MNQRNALLLASLFGTIAVGLGAFGAHALKSLLESTGRGHTYELAVRYNFFHALALLGTAALIDKYPGFKTVSWFFAAGILVFCGSLYVLALTNQSAWGAVTPFGGLLLIAGWISMGWIAFRSGKS
jgi:uncharacterized membrane protein YgdD (TMEM256/DUF423 family)